MQDSFSFQLQGLDQKEGRRVIFCEVSCQEVSRLTTILLQNSVFALCGAIRSASTRNLAKTQQQIAITLNLPCRRLSMQYIFQNLSNKKITNHANIYCDVFKLQLFICKYRRILQYYSIGNFLNSNESYCARFRHSKFVSIVMYSTYVWL